MGVKEVTFMERIVFKIYGERIQRKLKLFLMKFIQKQASLKDFFPTSF